MGACDGAGGRGRKEYTGACFAYTRVYGRYIVQMAGGARYIWRGAGFLDIQQRYNRGGGRFFGLFAFWCLTFSILWLIMGSYLKNDIQKRGAQ